MTTNIPKLSGDLRLFGKVDAAMLAEFFRQQSQVPDDGPLVLELSSTGGDADIGRRIALELRLWQEGSHRAVWFLGKSFVYSAGVTIMSAIPATRRVLTSDCELLIHERKLKKDIHLDGALRGCRSILQDVLAEIDSGQRLERRGFEQLVEGSRLPVDDLEARVMRNDWYLTAAEALELGLVGAVV